MSGIELAGVIIAFLTLQGSILGGAWKMGQELAQLVTRITVLESQVGDIRKPPRRTNSGEHRFDSSIPPKPPRAAKVRYR